MSRKAHTLFEQTNTFRDAMRRLGYEAQSYDLPGTDADNGVDLLAAIEETTAGHSTILDGTDNIYAGSEMLAKGPPPRPRVFCGSLCDWLDGEAPTEWAVDLIELIRTTPNLNWLLLSKRVQHWRTRLRDVADFYKDKKASNKTFCAGDRLRFVRDWLNGTPPENVWVGATVENQEMADKRIPELLSIPAKVRFLSCEPLLEAINLSQHITCPNCEGRGHFGKVLEEGLCFSPGSKGKTVVCESCGGNNDQLGTGFLPDGIHWVICGGESGADARPMHPDWARSLRDQCAAAGTPFFFKQNGEWAHTSNDDEAWEEAMERQAAGKLRPGQYIRGDDHYGWLRVGKARAGRLLDGAEHGAFPEVTQ